MTHQERREERAKHARSLRHAVADIAALEQRAKAAMTPTELALAEREAARKRIEDDRASRAEILRGIERSRSTGT